MSDVTKWTNMANGFLAISCQRTDPSGDVIEIPSLYCWTLRINLVIQILMVLPFLWKLSLYYKYYGNQLFRSRQRIIYLCILYGISSCLAFSVFNIVAIYYISFFVAQLLYWHVLGYFMIKLGKLAKGSMMFCLNLFYWLIFAFFIIYLVALLYFPLPSNFLFCPGLIDTQYWIYKSVVIISLLVLYAFAAFVLTKLLGHECESLLDLKRRKKRNREFAKLKALILIVWISELAHLAATVTHYYLSIGIDRCNMFINDENGLLESLSITFYRCIVVYAPLLALLWMLWLPVDEIQKNFNENYTDESLDFDTRFATRLTFRTGSQMRSNSQTSPAGYVYKINHSEGSDG